jgi:hypothetical protein
MSPGGLSRTCWLAPNLDIEENLGHDLACGAGSGTLGSKEVAEHASLRGTAQGGGETGRLGRSLQHKVVLANGGRRDGREGMGASNKGQEDKLQHVFQRGQGGWNCRAGLRIRTYAFSKTDRQIGFR